jgi:hypothetical protein
MLDWNFIQHGRKEINSFEEFKESTCRIGTLFNMEEKEKTILV